MFTNRQCIRRLSLKSETRNRWSRLLFVISVPRALPHFTIYLTTNHQGIVTYSRDMIPTNISLSSMCFRRQHIPTSAQLRTSLTYHVSWLALPPRNQLVGSNPGADLKVPALRLTSPPVRLTSPQPKVQGPNPFADPKVPSLSCEALCCRSDGVTLGVCPDWSYPNTYNVLKCNF